MDTVEQLDLDTFIAQRQAYDEAVLNTTRIDPYCSSSNWIIPAHEATFKPERDLILHCDGSYLVLCQVQVENWGQVWVPFEASWALASPAVGSHTFRLWREFARILRQDRDAWDGVFLCGMPTVGSLWKQCVSALDFGLSMYKNQTWLRCIASLEGGPDGYLSRRSAKFRKNLRRTLRRAEQADIQMVDLPEPRSEEAALQLLERAVSIEQHSWKGQLISGILHPEMYAFYRRMFLLLAQTGGLRFSVAQHQGRDIGYVFGGVFGTRYRGLQFSFDDSYRAYSIGSVMQWHTIARCCAEGLWIYDLGMEMDYKYAWSEETLTTGGLVINKHRP